MELINIEESRVVHLMYFHRPAGQLFVPEAAAKLVARYSFMKFPTVQELTERRELIGFSVGKFNDTQIQDMKVYSDGLVVEARSNTKILDAFLDDFLAWASDEFGIEPLANTKIERHHESSIVVRSSKDISKVINPASEIAAELNKLMKNENFQPRQFSVTGLILSVDNLEDGSRRKEPKVIVDRRLNIPYVENTFFSQAPLPTDDHLAFLARLETLSP